MNRIVKSGAHYIVESDDNILMCFNNIMDAERFIHYKFHKPPTLKLKEIRKAKLEKLNLLYK